MNVGKVIKNHRGKILMVLLLGLAVWIYDLSGGEFSRDAIMDYGKKLDAGWFIAGFLILPLLGFPISILLVLAGVKFGLWGGMALATVGVFFHNFAAYHLVKRWFRERFKSWMDRGGHKIPDMRGQNQIWFTVLFATVHGPPYFLKLYLLALTDISFRIYLWVGVPVYLLFCLVPVGAGSAVMEVNTTMLYGIVAAITVIALLGKWLSSKGAKAVDNQ